eukprot:CAMPEP_0184721454 /NCGR_PEP_ID=MMETSP0314-20130426/18504_1 /TAXON_ID=38298 /ORGANISM="Rhodella maculata, Strain CCMP 736" /LENGTH=434 /DNA_ID=CAMNT_0027185815 /DNA_START=63 /DNA_END=1367 /DNA_ORIENTATION=+
MSTPAATAATSDFFLPDLLRNKYKIIGIIGEGAYGVVCSAEDPDTGEKVAIKRIKRVMDSYPMATRILRELKFLRLLSAHENIVKVRDVLIPGDKDKFNDTYVVFELMPMDLRRLLRSKTELKSEHLKYFMWQILRGINFLHSSRVFHRDLKPDNILINAKCGVRICDFGLARAAFENQEDMVFWTNYVATRWYRAPELVSAHFTSYSTAIDMWSVGCIFGEIISRGKPLFPGRNEIDLMEKIICVTGSPNPEALSKMRNPTMREKIAALPFQKPVQLGLIFPDADPLCLDLLSKVLVFDPDRRLSAREALEHEFFAEFRHMGFGPPGVELTKNDFSFERKKMTQEDMRLEFLNEILYYHPDLKGEMLEGTKYGYQMPSMADQFGEAMEGVEQKTGKSSSTTLPKEVLAELNKNKRVNYKATTFGEKELAKYNK